MTRCAEASQDRDEPLVATASRVERWLLVESSGAWGPTSPPLDHLDAAVAGSLQEAAVRSAARLLAVRRPQKLSTAGRWLFAADSRPGRERLLSRHVFDDDELRALPDVFGPDVPAGWSVVDGPLWLVCTHGRRDLCCALRGRPVADALLALEPASVWEASHVGGDRFAANVVQLPEGHYFGRVTADSAPDLVRLARAGRLDLGSWRGRSSLSSPVQAAQGFARSATGRDRSDDLALVSQVEDGRDQWRVRLQGDVEVVVRYVRTGAPAVLTCSATEAKATPSFELVHLTAGDGLS